MKTTLTALIATATVANATIVHRFINEDIDLRITVENYKVNDIDLNTGWNLVNHNAARFKVEVLNTAENVRLNSIYYRKNHGHFLGYDDPNIAEVNYYDFDDLGPHVGEDPNMSFDNQHRPFVLDTEGRGSYNFTDYRPIYNDLDTENGWFDADLEGHDAWLVYNRTDGHGSSSITKCDFLEPMSIVYSTQTGSSTVTDAFENFTTVYEWQTPEDHCSTASVPEPSATLLTLLAMLGTLRRKR